MATAIGTSVKPDWSVEDDVQATTRVLDDLGLDSLRTFKAHGSGLPDVNDGDIQVAIQRGGDVAVSHKDWPARADLKAKMQGFRDALAGTGQRVYWAYYHEPEDNVENGSLNITVWQDRQVEAAEVAAEVDPNGDVLLFGTILMSWTLNPNSGRDYLDYLTPAVTAAIDFAGWDAYGGPHAADGPDRAPVDVMGNPAEASASVGLPWGIFETGLRNNTYTDDQPHAAWYAECIDICRSPSAYGVGADPALCYFLWNSGSGDADYRIDGTGTGPRLPLTIDVFRDAGAYAAEQDAECKALRAENDDLRAERDALLAENAALTSANADLVSERDALEVAVADAEAATAAEAARADDAEAEVADLVARVQAVDAAVSDVLAFPGVRPAETA